MKASSKRFIARMATIVFALASALLLEGLLTGGIAPLAAVFLLAASCHLTYVSFCLSLRKLPKKRKAAARPTAAKQPAPQVAPTLYVVKGLGGKKHAKGDGQPWHVA